MGLVFGGSEIMGLSACIRVGLMCARCHTFVAWTMHTCLCSVVELVVGGFDEVVQVVLVAQVVHRNRFQNGQLLLQRGLLPHHFFADFDFC